MRIIDMKKKKNDNAAIIDRASYPVSHDSKPLFQAITLYIP